jgi:hypothetical protein
MSKAAELAALIGSQSAQTDRNFFINGAMQVNQRGSVNTSDGSNVYSLDRWLTFLRGGPAATLSQSTDVPTGQGFANSFKLDVTTADALGTASDFCKVSQKMEGQNCQRLAKGTSSAKRVTLQFWVKSTITGTYIIELFDDDNTRQVSQAYTISSSNTWEHKTLTFPADTSGALADDNGNSFEVVWGLGMGSTYTSGTLNTSWASNTQANRFVGQVNALSSTSNEFYLTGCQLEIGETATPFEHEEIGTTLRKCQRYYFKFLEGNTKEIGVAWYFTAAHASFMLRYPTTMRATPTGTDSTGTGYYTIFRNGGSDAINSISFENGSTEQFSAFNNSEASGTAGQAGLIRSSNASAKIEFDAEL